jgi:hypothetical protein
LPHYCSRPDVVVSNDKCAAIRRPELWGLLLGACFLLLEARYLYWLCSAYPAALHTDANNRLLLGLYLRTVTLKALQFSLLVSLDDRICTTSPDVVKRPGHSDSLAGVLVSKFFYLYLSGK